MEESNLLQRITAIEDKIALRELVDNFSLVSDRKDNVAQASFFTQDGILISIIGDSKQTFEGRKGIEEGFAAILKPLDTVYHHNGQLHTTINGNEATGYTYCVATLVGKENDKTVQITFWANYEDQYRKENNKWLIAKRIATVAWQEKKEL